MNDRQRRAVRWLVAGRILWAWIFTIPVSGAIGWAVFHVFQLSRPFLLQLRDVLR